MKKAGLNELREMFLSFFEGKSHTRLESAPLIPHGDKSLLLINSGMAPLKKYFLGLETPPNVRLATCQKCIRTPDIERVGKTARHGTFFEMLGNFSFGDYFKDEAIAWAWEFFTKTLEIPEELLYISVYLEDDEAFDIWTQKIGVQESHMVRLGKEDNFWEHGSGPCGPCSEIYFDRGEKYGCGSDDCKPGCECDRFVEIWNLVFSQFDSDGAGNYALMENKNIDTGMGLERLACVIQGVENLFEVDTIQNIMRHICDFAGTEYKKDPKSDISLRVITDHIRSVVFMAGDGISGSNAGRGYVFRRLLRRAARHGRLLGIEKPFLFEIADTVINENKEAYKELSEKSGYIKKLIRSEEEAFAKTIDAGTELLNRKIDSVLSSGGNVLSGGDAFILSDTYGFPVDLTVEIAAEKGLSVDLEDYYKRLDEQKKKAKEDYKAKAKSSWTENAAVDADVPSTEFCGYSSFETESEVSAIYINGLRADMVNDGEEAMVILDRTPFYAESGGQSGDKGIIKSGSSYFEVTDTKKSGGHILHFGTASGAFSAGEKVKASVDCEKRLSTMRNHTSAHLLHSALRKVLGLHVHQAGQLVDDSRARFDFSHFEAVTSEQLKAIEDSVNNAVFENYEVVSEEMSVEDAKKTGATALFGEKYGDTVRVVNIGGESAELCGGTHIDATSKIKLFKILSESSVAAGVRRIEAVTGDKALELIDGYKDILIRSAAALKISDYSELPRHCAAMASEIKKLEREINALNEKLAALRLESALSGMTESGSGRVLTAKFENVSPDILRAMGDMIKDRYPDITAVLASVSGDGGSLLCVCGAEAVKNGKNAGKTVREIAAITGGKGGGRPDSAMAGIGDKSKLDEAFAILK